MFKKINILVNIFWFYLFFLLIKNSNITFMKLKWINLGVFLILKILLIASKPILNSTDFYFSLKNYYNYKLSNNNFKNVLHIINEG